MNNLKFVILIIIYSLFGMIIWYNYLYFYAGTLNNIYKSTFTLENLIYKINDTKINIPFNDLTSEFDKIYKVDGSYDVLNTMLSNGLKPKLVSFKRKRNVSSESRNLPVPNIVHLVHYGKPYILQFRHYLHMMGSHKFLQVTNNILYFIIKYLHLIYIS